MKTQSFILIPVLVAASTMAAKLSATSANRTGPNGLECTLTVERASAATAADAVVLSLRNSSDQAITIRTNRAPLATLLVDVFDERGKNLATPAKRFSTEDRQQFDDIVIAQHAQKEWRVRISQRLLPTVDLTTPITANIVVSLIYSFQPSSGGEFQSTVCTQSESGVLLTSATRR